MGQFSNVLLAIDKADSSDNTTEGPGVHTRRRWVKPGLLAQPSHSFY